ncbi:2,4-dienoyl-CoA reductase [Evansella caseinilytica]|uniref:2,4-dienoyl-CoA reductase n=1 Tax=Evansella caseinilytica TaxID=1503961 RepID=A0A1H3TUY9_9BACI|nr:FAD-dependent oxidoreductase [Evansella caseinilytica]SDZ53581.1 2,4-dienoyl-CoA reductase [Evansella caseinilytica]
MKFPNLFKPIRIKNTIINNRIIATPAGPYNDKAIGGAGVIVTGSVNASRKRASYSKPDDPYIFDKYEREGTKERVVIAQQAGAKASLEIIHAGQYARVDDYAIGPVGFTRKDGTEVRAMDEAMMEEVTSDWAETAKKAKEMGFDMVMLHFAHGWLPAQFLSPLFNNRTDEYGGSFENRAKFPKMIVDKVREAVGPDFVIDMRISASECVEGSIEFKDVLRFLKLIEDKIDMVNISAGLDINHEGNVHMAPTIFKEHMPNVDWAAEVKRHVDIVVSVVGAIMSPEEAESIIAQDKADFIALGRPLIADPFWPQKAKEGRDDDIVPCLRCQYCYHISTERKNVGCSVNPRYTRPHLVPLELSLAKKQKRVVIIGGGPGGMKAALVAAERGHEVILLEKEGELGGALRYSAYEALKVDLYNYMKYLINQINKSAIIVRTNIEATPEYVKRLAPDALIIAIGAKPFTPPIKGVDKSHVFQALDVYDKLDALTNDVVIIGGGSTGCELGVELARKEKKVTILEGNDKLATNGNHLYRVALRQTMVKEPTLDWKLNSFCKEVKNDGVVYLENGKEKFIPASTVIISAGMRANKSLLESFYGIVPDTFVVGDANQPRNVLDATREAYFVARNL